MQISLHLLGLFAFEKPLSGLDLVLFEQFVVVVVYFLKEPVLSKLLCSYSELRRRTLDLDLSRQEPSEV